MQPLEPDRFVSTVATGAVILDTRPWELVAARPIPGAFHLPLERIQGGAIPDVPLDATLLVVCAWGRKSPLAGLYLEARGFTDVLHLRGGMEALDAADLAAISDVRDATPGTEPR